jgi:hypothetical protein
MRFTFGIQCGFAGARVGLGYICGYFCSRAPILQRVTDMGMHWVRDPSCRVRDFALVGLLVSRKVPVRPYSEHGSPSARSKSTGRGIRYLDLANSRFSSGRCLPGWATEPSPTLHYECVVTQTPRYVHSLRDRFVTFPPVSSVLDSGENDQLSERGTRPHPAEEVQQFGFGLGRDGGHPLSEGR